MHVRPLNAPLVHRTPPSLMRTTIAFALMMAASWLASALTGASANEWPMMDAAVFGAVPVLGITALLPFGLPGPIRFQGQARAGRSTGVPAPRVPAAPAVLHRAPQPLNTGPGPLPVALSVLEAHLPDIRSILIVGSAAFALQREGSDTDVVVICRSTAADAIRTHICEQELEAALEGRKPDRAAEFIVLSSDEVESLFQSASPFAYAIRYGAIVQDDGYLRHLFRSWERKIPTVSFALQQLREMIIVPYYGSLRSLLAAGREDRCGSSCGTAGTGCGGRCPVSVLAMAVMRMLYVTLPLRGCMPLTKADAVAFTAAVYGEEDAAILREAVALLRGTRTPLCREDLRKLQSFAVRLFREIIAAAGSAPAVRNVLRDAAAVMRGNYHEIRDPAFQACFSLTTAVPGRSLPVAA